MAKDQREYDLVVYGAASFVGQILARHLHQRLKGNNNIRWAIAGRNREKLDAVNQDLGTQLPIILADAGDVEALQEMAANTAVIVSTVGPYALYGSELVAACAANGTDYCDLTGETQWIRRMVDQNHATAADNGARLVHCCGFDSIPSDMGLWFTQQQAKTQLGQTCSEVKLRVKGAKGGASGGTVASMLNVIDEAKRDPALRKELQNPYSLAPEGQRSGVRQAGLHAHGYDQDFNAWYAPFVMAAINTRVVHRSNALLGYEYGDNFLYEEGMLMGKGVGGRARAMGMTGGLGGFMAAASVGPSRSLLERFALPKPGEGPSPEEQLNGYWDIRFFGRADNGKTIQTKVTGDRDPGYGSTGKMLGEAAIALVETRAENQQGGCLTPAVALGDELLSRLQQHAGVTFEVL